MKKMQRKKRLIKSRFKQYLQVLLQIQGEDEAATSVSAKMGGV